MVIETVRVRLKDGISKTEFQQAAEQSPVSLRTCQGFGDAHFDLVHEGRQPAAGSRQRNHSIFRGFLVGEGLVPSRVTNTNIRVIRPGGHKTLPYDRCVGLRG